MRKQQQIALLLLLLLQQCYAALSGLGWGHYGTRALRRPASPSDMISAGGTKDTFPDSNSNKASLRRQPRRTIQAIYDDLMAGNVRRPCQKTLQHLLYWITAADAVHSMFLNEYSGLYQWLYGSTTLVERTALVPSVYSKLFYFARLRPRLLYAIGALVRALQLCTPLGKVIDPSIGVGAGINACALLAGSRWVKPFILGWTTTKWIWTWLGARQVDRAFLPITLSIHEWEDKKAKHKKAQQQKAEAKDG